MASLGNCRQGRDCRCRLITTDGGGFIDAGAESEPAPRSVLASPFFWLGGALSLLCWTAVYLWLTR